MIPVSLIQSSLRHAAGVLAALCVTPLTAGPVASFDVNDAVLGPYTLPGWTPVGGAANDADTISGSDGTHTLTLTTTADGQDRERNAGSFPSDADLWRDFWFVNGTSAVATISGLEANTGYSVEIWAYDFNSTPLRSADWTDEVTGNSATLAFDGGGTPAPASLADNVAVVQARSNGGGVVTLLASNNGGQPGIFVSGLRVSEGGGSVLIEVEAESGTLGSDFATGGTGGTDYIGITNTSSGTGAPGAPERVASYPIVFPAAGAYRLYARIQVGPGGFNDDSLFFANSFGAKSPTNSGDWVFRNGLAAAGYTGNADVVDAGGSAGTGIWKWIRFDGSLSVPAGALTQTYQIGGREDGLLMDRFVFAPSDINLTVAELESGIFEPLLSYEGPDGIAIHRFGKPNGARTADGAHPSAGLMFINGELVGCTLAGAGTGEGAAFRLGIDGESFESLTSFIGAINGAHPQGDLLASGGMIIGASSGGGANGTGAIFELAADGTATRLHSFAPISEHTGSNNGGAVPSGPLASDGNTIYGAASAGGTFANGTLFSVSTGGAGFTVLHEFSDLDPRHGTNSDGVFPAGAVLINGRLFGIASAGGHGGAGTIFSMNPNGSDFQTLHHFSPLDSETATNADGAFPCGRIAERNGVIYGTTLCGGSGGNGTVFSIDTDGTDFLTLYQFSATDPLAGANADGARPSAGLSISGNVLYGTTSAGGSGATGTVFALDPFVPDIRTFHQFEPTAAGGTNSYGAHPAAPPLRVGSALYGTTFAGGPGGTGTVYRVPIPLTVRPSASANSNGTITSHLTVRGTPGAFYRIQASNDLSSEFSWQNILSSSADDSGFVILQENQLLSPRRFYRVAELPSP